MGKHFKYDWYDVELIAIKDPYYIEATHHNTKNPICPHCGKEDTDAWEIDFGPGLEGNTEVTCGTCDKEYEVYRRVDVYYSTYEVKK